MSQKGKCLICNSDCMTKIEPGMAIGRYFCPICGIYEIWLPLDNMVNTGFDLNHLGAFLAYNGFKHSCLEGRYYTNMDKEKCIEQQKEYDSGNRAKGKPIFMSPKIVDDWYPKEISEQINFILSYFQKFYDKTESLEKEILCSVLFVDRFENTLDGTQTRRNPSIVLAEINKKLRYLIDMGFIENIKIF